MKCRKCLNPDLTANDFYIRSDNFRLRTVCKECDKKAAKLQVRGQRISPQTYDALVKQQKGRCPICEQKAKLLIDTGENRQVRGLLCQACRNGLKYFHSKVDLLKEAIRYIEETK